VARNKILNVSSGILFLALLGGCSSNQPIKPPKQVAIQQPVTTPVTTPVVRAKTIRKRVVTKRVAPRVITKKITKRKVVRRFVNTKKTSQQRIAQQRIAQQRAIQKRASQQWVAQQRAAKKRQQNHYLTQRKVVRQVPRTPRRHYPPRKQYIVKKAPQRVYRKVYIRPRTAIRQYQPARLSIQPAPIQRVQQPQLRRASLTGDFANNPAARRFIDKMVSRHGFDRYYLNGVLSNAQATSWMRKMAAKDERPKIKRKHKKRNRTPSWTRYRSHFLTSRHINAGVAFYHKNRQALERAERQFGVPKEYIMGIMGVETIFGGNVGKNRAIDALTTMAFMNKRRGRYFESELESYLLMTRNAHLNPLVPKASYAGALGLSQFMPSNIKKYGVDFDGDGGVNLWEPADAIASIAKYFNRHGWRTGEMVAVPARSKNKRYRSLKTGYKHTYRPSRLSRKGVTTRYQHNMRGSLSLIKLKTYGGDELWLGGKNFYVITRYNHSTHYAMAVHQLAQAIKNRIEPNGAGPRKFINPRIAPTKKRSISVEEAMELLSASNNRKDAVVELRELIAKGKESLA